MIRSLTVAIIGLMTIAAAPAYAQSAWTGEASLTGSRTTGNTDTTDIGLGLKLENAGDIWRHKFNASADFGEVDGVRNRERFVLGYQIERDVSDRLYGFARGDYFQDEFGSFTDGYFVGGGLGYNVILPEPVAWDLTAGAGFRSQTSAFDVEEEEFSVTAGSDFDWQLNENVSLYDDAGLIYASSNTYLWNEIGLTANLMGSLAARASFRIDHNTDAPLGTESTDTITRFGIVYTIG
ncbi:MAG: DUF481 domain-containing protein [Pseudomonadota bacterium]